MVGTTTSVRTGACSRAMKATTVFPAPVGRTTTPAPVAGQPVAQGLPLIGTGLQAQARGEGEGELLQLLLVQLPVWPGEGVEDGGVEVVFQVCAGPLPAVQGVEEGWRRLHRFSNSSAVI